MLSRSAIQPVNVVFAHRRANIGVSEAERGCDLGRLTWVGKPRYPRELFNGGLGAEQVIGKASGSVRVNNTVILRRRGAMVTFYNCRK
jgi:hypothetical protein